MIRISDVKPAISGGGSAKRRVGSQKSAAAQPAKNKRSSFGDDTPIAAELTALLYDAVKTGASAVHIEPHDKTLQVRYRVDGLLREGKKMALTALPALVGRVKTLASLDTSENRVPQDGRFDTLLDNKRFVVRASFLPVSDGEKVVLHLADQSTAPHDLERLGYWGHSLQALTEAVEHTHGFVIIGGPAGSGKTATLYGLLHVVAHPARSIATIEATIEHRVPGINQTPVNTKAGMTFATALRAVLNQDPNVVMVSDLQEPESTGMALHAALAGRLVLGGIASRNVAGALSRIITMPTEPYLIASATRAVVNQRLVRRLCTTCRESYRPAAGEFEAACKAVGLRPRGALAHLGELEKTAAVELKITKVPAAVASGKVNQLWRAKEGGCAACGGTGYKGRVVIAEVLTITPTVQKLILASATTESLYDQAVAEGMVPLPLDGFVKSALGITSIAEVLRAIDE